MTTLRQSRRSAAEERYGLSDLVQWKQVAGNGAFPMATTLNGSPAESIPDDFLGYVQGIYKRNGVVAACMTLRESIFAEIRFRFARLDQGKIGAKFGTPDLGILEQPFGPNTTTGELGVRMIQDADLAGNFYAVRNGDRLWRRRPDRMAIMLDGNPAEDEFVSVQGYLYYPQGIGAGNKHYTYLPEQMCHWSPKPDPEADYRGMSWITPVLREIRSDGAATDHKLEFFDNAATPNMVVKTPESVMTQAQFEEFKARMDAAHVGRGNRHKTLFLVPGSDIEVVGRDFQQMEFSEIQGRDEDRIASAAGVPAVLIGLKESLQGASLNQGNFAHARRRFADGTMRPLYRSAASALQSVVQVPQRNGTAILTYEDEGIAFFREDRKDAVEIQQGKALAIRTYTDAGFTPESAVACVEQENPDLLKHSGLYSVQLQAPGSGQPPAA